MNKLGSYLLFLIVIVPPLLLLFVNLYGKNMFFDKDFVFKSLKPANHSLSDSIQYLATLPLKDESDYKYILTWCEAYGGQTYGWAYGPHKFKEAACPESRCFLTSNRSLLSSLSKFDAIMFHQRSFTWRDAPSAADRHPEQHYVHWMFESPAHLNYDIVPLVQLSNYFNWSMSYRIDSTFPAPYGSYENISPHLSGSALSTLITQYGQANTKLAAKDRSKSTPLAAWFVSNCHGKSGRENAVKQLKKYMGVDVYGSGSCSDPGLSCPRSQDNDCLRMLNNTYKFYLSLENSLCGDYVTEKLWKVLSYNVIPVVLNGANMTNIAPPNSYIDFDNFRSIEELAKYLKQVAEDDKLFASYFWWRDFYTINNHLKNYEKAYCSLCEALHDNSRGQEVIKDMKKYWQEDAQCHTV